MLVNFTLMWIAFKGKEILYVELKYQIYVQYIMREREWEERERENNTCATVV